MTNEGDVSITSSGTRVNGKTAEEQEQRLDKIREKQSADRVSADAADAAKRAAAEAEAARRHAEAEAIANDEAAARKKADEQREAVEKIGAAALTLGSSAIGAAAENAKKGELAISTKTAFFGIAAIVIIALLLFLAWPRLSAALFPAPETHVAADLDSSAVMGTTSADISGAILGEARQKQELVVWEQDVQVESAISQALANIPVFSKTKRVHSFGTGVYTVEVGAIGGDAIAVDESTRTVRLSIPRTQLSYITKDLEKTEFEDTKHALLGFGDVKLTQEQQNLLDRSIEEAMRTELTKDECFADADEAALLVVYDAYQPLVAKVDDSYTLDVVFATAR